MLVAVTALSGCASAPQFQAPGSTRAAAGSPRALPAGVGREILERECKGCHDLGGLWAYQGYYNESRWHDMIVTMVGHGADLDQAEIETLTSYLVEHFGPGTRATRKEGS